MFKKHCFRPKMSYFKMGRNKRKVGSNFKKKLLVVNFNIRSEDFGKGTKLPQVFSSKLLITILIKITNKRLPSKGILSNQKNY